MMIRVMWDAISANIGSIPSNAAMVAGYDTGTPDIVWGPHDWTMFPDASHVHIDQGGIGSPVPAATVRDVESGAWTPEAAVTDVSHWHTLRPTIYCNESTLPRVLAAGWKGDLWLAIPSSSEPASPPEVKDCTVVAVQWRFAGEYDQSVVFDQYWPNRPPADPGVMYAAPNGLAETATVPVMWQAVAPVLGKPPASYTVQVLGMNGKEYYRNITSQLFDVITGLHLGWTFEVRVWANGGNQAPPHATMTIHT